MTKAEIARAFRALGIKEDDKFIVHSSLKSFGHVEGGARTVVEALMETAPRGTIVMPSFNHGEPYDRGEIFDIRATPTINGAIPDAFWRMPGVFRSMNPTHSFAVWGEDAEEIARAHERADTMGEGSPLDYLYKHGGHALLLGVGFNRNTFHHYVERIIQAPCLRGRGEEYDVIDETGAKKRARTWSWRAGGCPVDDPARYAERMRDYTREAKIGECAAKWYALSDSFRVVRGALETGLNCYPPCDKCEVRPRVCAYTVDDEEG